MQIKFDWKIIIFVLFFFIFKIEYIYLIFLIFTIIHEIVHMIVGILVGFEPLKITITPFGAHINFKIGIENYNTKIQKRNNLFTKEVNCSYGRTFSKFFNSIYIWGNKELHINNIYKFNIRNTKFISNISIRWRKNSKTDIDIIIRKKKSIKIYKYNFEYNIGNNSIRKFYILLYN